MKKIIIVTWVQTFMWDRDRCYIIDLKPGTRLLIDSVDVINFYDLTEKRFSVLGNDYNKLREFFLQLLDNKNMLVVFINNRHINKLADAFKGIMGVKFFINRINTDLTIKHNEVDNRYVTRLKILSLEPLKMKCKLYPTNAEGNYSPAMDPISEN